ncbi:hypothetical protein FGB62_14g282 [Gracilaria domingensis]|nr:hypothetical protein FGB62_14g282 [Gracilaria domingensis]
MAVERSTASPADRDTARQQSVRNRILYKEWAEDAIDRLSTALAQLHSQPPQSTEDYLSKLPPILDLLDTISAACDTAAASVKVAEAERQDIMKQTAAVEQEIVSHIELVHALRQRLSMQRKMAERNKQYDAIASLILQWPPVEESDNKTRAAEKKIITTEDQIKALARVKEDISKEVNLMLHCVGGLKESCRDINNVVDESTSSSQQTERERKDNSDAMDVSA